MFVIDTDPLVMQLRSLVRRLCERYGGEVTERALIAILRSERKLDPRPPLEYFDALTAHVGDKVSERSRRRRVAKVLMEQQDANPMLKGRHGASVDAIDKRLKDLLKERRGDDGS